jgi:hypothetical protein
MNKHTKGPWAIETNHVVAGSVRVAVVDTPNLHAGVDWVEADANARLIAAAPLMLVALRAMTTLVEQSADRIGYATGSPIDKQIRSARAAIDKAAKESP